MKKFIVAVHISEEIIIIEANCHEDVSEVMLNEISIDYEDDFTVVKYSDIKTCRNFKIIDGELFDSTDEKPNDNQIEGAYRLKQLTYSIHKKNGEKMLKASYNFKTEKGWVWTSKYLCFDKTGYPKEKALEWLNERISPEHSELATNTESIYSITDHFIEPKEVEVDMNDAGYPIIINEIW